MPVKSCVLAPWSIATLTPKVFLASSLKKPNAIAAIPTK
jgi:hypothetical protein